MNRRYRTPDELRLPLADITCRGQGSWQLLSYDEFESLYRLYCTKNRILANTRNLEAIYERLTNRCGGAVPIAARWLREFKLANSQAKSRSAECKFTVVTGEVVTVCPEDVVDRSAAYNEAVAACRGE